MGILYFLGIKHCYNFIFCFILTVHGGIRHLEKYECQLSLLYQVHGGIRHLENKDDHSHTQIDVHGGIRHLEKEDKELFR